MNNDNSKRLHGNNAKINKSSDVSPFYQTFPLTNFIKDNQKIKAPKIPERPNEINAPYEVDETKFDTKAPVIPDENVIITKNFVDDNKK